MNGFNLKKKEGDIFLLDNEDGEGPFVDHAISCQLNSGFRLLLVSKTFDESRLSDYTVFFETNVGRIRMKKSGLLFLDSFNELMIEPTYKRLQLRSPSGILDNNVAIERKE